MLPVGYFLVSVTLTSWVGSFQLKRFHKIEHMVEARKYTFSQGTLLTSERPYDIFPIAAPFFVCFHRFVLQRTLTIGGSITVQMTTCLTGLDLTKQVKLLFIQHKQRSLIQTK